MFYKVSQIWNRYGFEILVLLAIAIILFCALFRIGKKGTWTSLDLKDNYIRNPNFTRKPPQESKGEIECRRVLETLFKEKFPKARPNILKNPVTSDSRDNNLELDCYNENLKLACEYNGPQHYSYIPFFHKTRDAFLNQKYRDELKRRMCKENDIKLIEVPYTIKVENIESYIIENLRKFM